MRTQGDDAFRASLRRAERDALMADVQAQLAGMELARGPIVAGNGPPLGLPRARRASSAFSPRDIPGLVLWLDADLGITTVAGPKVSAWADQSATGANLVQGTDAQRPNYVAGPNGHSAVQVPSVGAFSLVDAAKPVLTGLTGYTDFAVAKINDVVSNTVLLNTPGTGDALGMNASTMGKYANGASGYVTHPFTDTTAHHIIETKFDGSQVGNAARLVVNQDGTAWAGSTYVNTIPAVLGANVGITIGNPALATPALLSSWLIYNRTLTASESARVGRYLGTRYAIATTY